MSHAILNMRDIKYEQTITQYKTGLQIQMITKIPSEIISKASLVVVLILA